MSKVIRTCVGCREKFDKQAVYRYVFSTEIVEDISRTLPGRGAYLCVVCRKVYNSAGDTKEKTRILKGLSRELHKSQKHA